MSCGRRFRQINFALSLLQAACIQRLAWLSFLPNLVSRRTDLGWQGTQILLLDASALGLRISGQLLRALRHEVHVLYRCFCNDYSTYFTWRAILYKFIRIRNL